MKVKKQALHEAISGFAGTVFYKMNIFCHTRIGSGLYAILKQKSKHLFLLKLFEKEGFLWGIGKKTASVKLVREETKSKKARF